MMVGIAQLLLVVAAGALWMAARLPWVVIGSFDELGPPKEVTLPVQSLGQVSEVLLMLAAAVAALAVRGWPLRALAVLLAAASFAVGYLGISLWVVPDVAARGADLAHVPVVTLVGSARHYWGAVAAVLAAVCALLAAVFLMSSAVGSRVGWRGHGEICGAPRPPVDCPAPALECGRPGGSARRRAGYGAADVGANDLGSS
ncbi:hypothetical protein J113_11180 [Mycobacterium tuberculosis CAS/NITR204]|uniref:Transmembrane protein n=1 Tax=Mycobacterium tuberculosis CAS/NITR204 TaxID=1310114 RepID=R4MGL8_MYCTX|nr:hypothetical protein J113_11180 [Mycobacterium tuberculosis CAS/NITR204]